jgi:hypothetical protein
VDPADEIIAPAGTLLQLLLGVVQTGQQFLGVIGRQKVSI